jgi:hypothetical protein
MDCFFEWSGFREGALFFCLAFFLCGGRGDATATHASLSYVSSLRLPDVPKCCAPLLSSSSRLFAMTNPTSSRLVCSREVCGVNNLLALVSAFTLPRGAYNSTAAAAMKFERPEGMSTNCEWFPTVGVVHVEHC